METKRKYKKKKLWSNAEEKLFVDLWGEKINELRASRKHSHIYEELKKQLEENGVKTEVQEIQIKIQNLTSKYRKENAAIGFSGGSPSNWPLYNKIHSILGSFKINNIQTLLENSIKIEDNLQIQEMTMDIESIESLETNYILETGSTPSTGTAESTPLPGPSRLSPSAGGSESTPTAGSSGECSTCKRSLREPGKHKIDNIQEKILAKFEEMEKAAQKLQEHIIATDEEMLMLEKKKIELLDKFVKNNSQITEAFIKFLDRK